MTAADDKKRQSDKTTRPSYGAAFRQADQHVGVAFQVALALVVYVVAGNWLDKRLGTGPWLTLLGAVLGFASMMYLLVRLSSRASNKGQKGGSKGDSRASQNQAKDAVGDAQKSALDDTLDDTAQRAD